MQGGSLHRPRRAGDPFGGAPARRDHQPAPAALHASVGVQPKHRSGSRGRHAVGDGCVAKKCEYLERRRHRVRAVAAPLRACSRVSRGSYPNSDLVLRIRARRAAASIGRLGGRRVHPLPAGTTPRVPRSVEQVERQVDIHIVHQHSARCGNVLGSPARTGTSHRACHRRRRSVPALRCPTDAMAGTVYRCAGAWRRRPSRRSASAKPSAKRCRATRMQGDELGVRWCGPGNTGTTRSPTGRSRGAAPPCSSLVSGVRQFLWF